MQIPVVVEQVANNGYRAKSGEPFALTAEAPTEAEALDKLRSLLHVRLQSGMQVTTLDIPIPANPWLTFQGIFDPNDPSVKLWEETMAENRRKADEGPDVP